ncbi:putative pentatricopeptide repeat-containing protein At5g40405 isoform X2 [Nymphaea colorata]|uniref:putative pentatricopeptide repeat-containing protein At5g40405 isoform X2 n=1 Tax=Nymphaea colorata TaxID=210225 RepID=UPI00214F44AB|nr:putative pentatricopeptide repeat-containing protein At5g40405 isoform X2 [Nymphaea colorata]
MIQFIGRLSLWTGSYSMLNALRSLTKHPTPTALALFDSSINPSSMNEVMQIHAQMITSGLSHHPRFLGKLISLSALSADGTSDVNYARLILDHSENPTIFAVNTMIRAYSKSHQPDQGLLLFRHALHRLLEPDNFTFTFLVRSCTQLHSLELGESAHSAAFLRGFESDSHVESALIHMYSSFGCVGAAHQLFIKSLQPDVVAWTALVGAWAKAGELDYARNLFDHMPERDVVAWNAMITGYAQGGSSIAALSMFHEMQMAGVKANEATMVSVLSACGHLGALDQGKWVHVYIEKNKLRLNVNLGTSLIDMYAKCGEITRAMEVFNKMSEKNVLTWTTAMNGLAMHGLGRECLELFDSMRWSGLVPNEITYVAVLRACSVAGLVEKGQLHFQSMIHTDGLEPIAEHYGCMVDILGRAGRLDEAIDFINSMPVVPHVGVWGALLNACRLYKRTDVAQYALRKIVELEAKNDGAYVLLSNTYASTNTWDGVGNVRELMKRNGVKKVPGCSVIEVDGVVHEFFVGDKLHPKHLEIEMKLEEISSRLTLEGYVPNTEEVLFDIEEEEKQNALCRHSERLAIAFGFISLKEGMPIRIVKNLRICNDCHDVFKLISKVFSREIIVRDRNRFHHFKDGSCSCMDYW